MSFNINISKKNKIFDAWECPDFDGKTDRNLNRILFSKCEVAVYDTHE